MKPELSIVVPCYNESKNIPLVLEKFRKVLEEAKKTQSVELILVDNNSQDNSALILRRELAKKKYSFTRTVFQPIAGYGSAISKGVLSAQGEFICWTHADLQTDPLDALIAYDLILRSGHPEKTYIKGKRYGRPIADKLINTIGMSLFETMILKKALYDINAQPNLFHHSFLKIITDPPADFSFDLYAYYLAKRAKYKVIRFPVFFGNRIHGESAWNFGWKSKAKFIKRTLKFSLELKKRLKS